MYMGLVQYTLYYFLFFVIISIGTGTVFIYSYWHLKNEVNTNIYSSTETLIY